SLKYVEQKGMEEENMAYVAVAKILTAASYQRLVDIYGDIPYSQGVEGFNGNVTPVYDDAEAIYDDLVVQLDSAILLLNQAVAGSQTIDETSDIIAGGDLETWIQIANTFKLRILIHQTEVRESYIRANLNFDAAGFISSTITANPGYQLNTDGKMNPFYARYGKDYKGDLTSANQQYGLNVFLSNLYKMNSDPRLELCWEPGVATHNYNTALQLGINTTEGVIADEDPLHWKNGVPRMGPGIYGSSDDGVVVLSIMETNFLIAEALARGYNLSSAGVSGTAKDYWEAGILESFRYYGGRKGVAIDDLYATYIESISGNVGWNSSNPVKSIIYQKYLAMVGINHYETWTDYRRTGYPEPGDPNVIETSMISYYFNIVREQVPVRMLYPQRELDINAENVQAAITKTGVAYNSEFIMDARIFWDAN
ncbi:MAG: SusD/RagB family nutrient-binding outer membrane lipoprotein, partial [Prolixibacteraceae bacterium]|nr:SusD/RagB family nutrient-binding outer membrane lipoprotein [Prolixibacteraceae bacterium]